MNKFPAKYRANCTYVLETPGLRITRGNTPIIKGIDWQVGPGEHWAILGPNGAGKTSLLKSITGYLAPTGGAIRLLGREYGRTDWRELRGRVGIVTNAFASAIPPAESALETVMSGRFAQLDLWAHTTRRDRAAAQALLRASGIPALHAREWAYLSQGERQRVLIARAQMGNPEVLILDEPCAGLDPVARESFLRLVDRLANGGTASRRRRAYGGQAVPSNPALILVTHHVEEITPNISHVLLLSRGRVVAAGKKGDIMTSANLSKAFGARLRIRKTNRRFQLVVG